MSNSVAARNGNKEFTKILYITVGSVSELDTQIEISKESGLGCLERPTKLQNDPGIVTKMLYDLICATSMKP